MNRVIAFVCGLFKKKQSFKAGQDINANVSKEVAEQIFSSVNTGGDIFGLARQIKEPQHESYTVVLKGK